MRNFLQLLRGIVLFPFRLIRLIFRGLARWFNSIREGFNAFFTEEPEDTPLPDAFARTVENPSAILEHLNDLRKHL
ncbi:MAG TPA: hypothetical protein VF823_07735, partial [Anaerolineales bacterium]